MNFLKIVLFLLLSTMLCAQKVEITSEAMKAENLKKEVHFIGNAHIKKIDDWLHADEVIVYFDDNNQTKMYEAVGAVTFEFIDIKGHYKGKADKVTYFPEKSHYILTGNAIVDDLTNRRHVDGDSITLDMTSGSSEVKSAGKKPVKFTFDVEDSK